MTNAVPHSNIYKNRRLKQLSGRAMWQMCPMLIYSSLTMVHKTKRGKQIPPRIIVYYPDLYGYPFRENKRYSISQQKNLTKLH